jgi:hypothetical protein
MNVHAETKLYQLFGHVTLLLLFLSQIVFVKNYVCFKQNGLTNVMFYLKISKYSLLEQFCDCSFSIRYIGTYIQFSR